MGKIAPRLRTAGRSPPAGRRFARRTVSVSTEMSLHVLAYNLKRALNVLGVKPLLAALAT